MKPNARKFQRTGICEICGYEGIGFDNRLHCPVCHAKQPTRNETIEQLIRRIVWEAGY